MLLCCYMHHPMPQTEKGEGMGSEKLGAELNFKVTFTLHC